MEREKDMQGSRGYFIAFEGIDGSGKSTQARILAERMRQAGFPCYQTMEPTDGPVGLLLRQILTGRMQADPGVIAALFAADRLDHLTNQVNGIVKKIEEGVTVITDRYYFSSYAYHSVDLPMDWVIQTNAQSSGMLRPSVTVFLDITPELAMERIAANRAHQELFEKKPFLEKVRGKYKEAFEKQKAQERVLVVDGSRETQEVADDIWVRVKGCLARGRA